MAEKRLLLGLINDLLNWREYSHEVLGDYLEESGFGRRLFEHGGLHTRVGVVRALINIGALDLDWVSELDLPTDEKELAIELSDF